VADARTEVTELATGLGMLGYETLFDALRARPPEVVNVPPESLDRAQQEALGTHRGLAETAFENGRAFLEASDGLRGRRPVRVEWKGPHRPPGYDLLPADLRIDHVYLVSCKYGSLLLMNASPSHVFEERLQIRRSTRGEDWFETVAPQSYRLLYGAVRSAIGDGLPVDPAELTREHRQRIRHACARQWPVEVEPAYAEFCRAVSTATARRWSGALRTVRDRELMLWRMLRLSDCPYFVLGSDRQGPVRLRVATPWDWRQQFCLSGFDIWAAPAGQPRVEWCAAVQDRYHGARRVVRGHVEIRWSHGRFCGVPEAKIYLDTPQADVPGYFPLAAPEQPLPSPGTPQVPPVPEHPTGNLTSPFPYFAEQGELL